MGGGGKLEREDSTRLSPEEGRHFGLVVGGAFLALAGIFWWRGHEALTTAAVLPGVLLIAGALLVPGRMGPVQSLWMELARRISRVTTPILMGIVYYLVITPSGLIMRALGHDPLAQDTRGGGERRRDDTSWIARQGEPSPTDMERRF